MDDCVTHHICACQERKLRQLEEQIQAMQSKLQAVEQASKNNFEEYQLQGDRTIRVERESDALRAQVSEARDVCTAAEETEHQLRARIRNLEAQLGTLGIRRRSGRCKLKKVPQG